MVRTPDSSNSPNCSRQDRAERKVESIMKTYRVCESPQNLFENLSKSSTHVSTPPMAMEADIAPFPLVEAPPQTQRLKTMADPWRCNSRMY